MFLFTRSRNPDANIAGALRAVVFARDPNLPVPALWSLRERLGRAYAVERQTTAVLGGFAAVALALASVGLYTVVAHASADAPARSASASRWARHHARSWGGSRPAPRVRWR
jgi:hypothetical protein